MVDKGTGVDEDPMQVEIQKLERIIDHLRNDRDSDMKKILEMQT